MIKLLTSSQDKQIGCKIESMEFDAVLNDECHGIYCDEKLFMDHRNYTVQLLSIMEQKPSKLDSVLMVTVSLLHLFQLWLILMAMLVTMRQMTKIRLVQSSMV